MYKLILIGLMGFVTACGGGGGSTPVVNLCEPSADVAPFIYWTGSANGNFVVDGDDDFVRFDANTRWMELNGFFYPAITVDLASNLYEDFDGDGNYNYADGGVYRVVSGAGCEIAGAVADNGYYIDVEEIGVGIIQVSLSTKLAVYARPVLDKVTGVVEEGDQQPKFGSNPEAKVTILGTATGFAQ